MDRIGDVRINYINKVSSNVVGYVCVKEGNPGEWEAITKDGCTLDIKQYNDNGILITTKLKTNDYMYYTVESSIIYRDKVFKNIVHTFIEPEGNKDNAILIFNRIYNDLF